MKTLVNNVTKYYKYTRADWIQPVLTSNTSDNFITFIDPKLSGSTIDTPTSPSWGSEAFGQLANIFKAMCAKTTDYFVVNKGAKTYTVVDLFFKNKLDISSIYIKGNVVTGSASAITGSIIYDLTNGSPEYISSSMQAQENTHTINKVCSCIRLCIRPDQDGAKYPSRITEIKINARQITDETLSTKDNYDFSCVEKDIKAYKKYFIQTDYTSNTTFIVPNGVTSLHIDCVASKGYYFDYGKYSSGGGRAGKGGRVECDLKVTPGQKLYLTIGVIPSQRNHSEYNASDIRLNGNELTDRIIVAGGGGNGNSDKDEPNYAFYASCVGGDGGGLIGKDGSTPRSYNLRGLGGTQTEGGKPNGDFGLGGSPTSSMHINAGGAGWYGGGIGGTVYHHSQTRNTHYFGGGGGGSSYTHPTLCSNVKHTQGYQDGNGYIILTYETNSSNYNRMEVKMFDEEK